MALTRRTSRPISPLSGRKYSGIASLKGESAWGWWPAPDGHSVYEKGGGACVDIPWKDVITFLSGGAAVKIGGAVIGYFAKRKAQADAREQFVQQHLDPLLKATDELFSKLRSLATEDSGLSITYVRIATVYETTTSEAWRISSEFSGLASSAFGTTACRSRWRKPSVAGNSRRFWIAWSRDV